MSIVELMSMLEGHYSIVIVKIAATIFSIGLLFRAMKFTIASIAESCDTTYSQVLCFFKREAKSELQRLLIDPSGPKAPPIAFKYIAIILCWIGAIFSIFLGSLFLYAQFGDATSQSEFTYKYMFCAFGCLIFAHVCRVAASRARMSLDTSS